MIRGLTIPQPFFSSLNLGALTSKPAYTVTSTITETSIYETEHIPLLVISDSYEIGSFISALDEVR